MIKQINKLLKLVGLNLVRAKRRKVKAGYRSHVQIEDANTGPYTVKELVNCPLESKCNRPLSDYMGESEWHDTQPFAAPVPNPGKTHFVNDDCPGGHRGETGQPHSDNKISGPTS